MSNQPAERRIAWRPSSWAVLFLALYLILVATCPLLNIGIPEIFPRLVGTFAAFLFIIGA